MFSNKTTIKDYNFFHEIKRNMHQERYIIISKNLLIKRLIHKQILKGMSTFAFLFVDTVSDTKYF